MGLRRAPRFIGGAVSDREDVADSEAVVIKPTVICQVKCRVQRKTIRFDYLHVLD